MLLVADLRQPQAFNVYSTKQLKASYNCIPTWRGPRFGIERP